ncbi:hypothetical protein ACFYN0_29600 [Streptomyces sp. NPDC006704]|uniref:hypothetical protein n=1 Tax=Streptomyces sp. NPDC006704 TaxID=3364760 RepID=UPI0036B1C599
MTGTACVFPGRGCVRVGMGRDVLVARPELALAHHRVAADHLGIPLTQLCRHGPAREPVRRDGARPGAERPLRSIAPRVPVYAGGSARQLALTESALATAAV